MSDEVRDALPADARAQIADALSAGDTTCTVCDAVISATEPGPNVLALRAPDGRTRIRLAHVRCAESRLIRVERLPTTPSDEAPADEHGLAWLLTARARRLPTVILVCDVDRLEHLDARGSTLITALRLHGWRGGRGLEDIQPERRDDFDVARVDGGLWLHTPFGMQPLLLGESEPSSALLQVAARQREMLVVLVSDLVLGLDSLNLVDERLQRGEAIAARVSFEDARPDGHRPPRRLGLLRLLGLR